MIRERLKICLIIFLGLLSVNLTAQISKKDSIPKLKYPFKNNEKGSLFLNTVTQKEVRYDKKLNKFVLVEKIGNYEIDTPIFMTPKEYDRYKLKNDLKTYFKAKLDATSKKNKNNSNARKNLLPKYYVNSKFFEDIFGGNEVEVIPTGQVSVKLGGVYQNTENPQISVDNQSSFTFDFDQKIAASLQAKIGKRLKVTANYDTQSTFDFQNVVKLEYTPTEDDIIRNIDAGNISMPIKNSLINGAQALFGVKTQLQFGKTYVTAAFSQQNSQSKTVTAKGGSVVEEFELRASDYDNDRHFFLSQFFRETFEESLKEYPLITSPVTVTKVEVWITNRNSNVKDFRSIVAFADIGESKASNLVNANVNPTSPATVNVGGLVENLPYNEANDIANLLTQNNGIRDVATLTNTLTTAYNMQQGIGYSYLQNATRLQVNRDFKLHPQLGYISLNRRLNDGEVLAVAYEYTVVGASNGKSVFRVGEFSNDGVVAPKNIAVKLLRSETLTTKRPGTQDPFPTWQLMMKNIYGIGAYPLEQEGFRFELMYRDDKTGVLLNTLQGASNASIKDKTLLNLLNLDKLNQSQYAVPEGDGFFDYVPGVTVEPQKGYIIFPETEPFGKYLKGVLTNPDDQKKYVFEELYLTTKIEAKNEYQNKDKFFLKGYFKSDKDRGIFLGFNIPRGSVRVTAGGRRLVEGIDYVVDYQFGTVKIIDPGLESSGVPINASVENNNFFNQQRKTFFGVDVEHRFSEDFTIGATFLNVTEKPITPKVSYGVEPIDNIMLGFNVDYATEVPFFTKMVNKLPFVDTDVVSKLNVRADMAYLIPGSPSGINVDGTATSYLDDFEASQIPINLNTPQLWYTASTPIKPGFNGDKNDLTYNDKRGKLAWYNVDQLFYSSRGNKPSNVDNIELSREEVRQISYSELFPNTDLDLTQINLVRTLDLAYFPSERGPYNFNTKASDVTNNKFTNPEENWAGIMRPLTVNNFNQANVEYVQFWLMDPYENYSITEKEGLPATIDPKNPINQVGELYLNLGNISEDILRDNLKQYENGLPADGAKVNGANVRETAWGYVPINPSILYTFDNNPTARKFQDVGLDGLSNDEESAFYQSKGVDVSNLNPDDISSDNFKYFRGNDYDSNNASILTRYKHFNNTEGNSPTINQSGQSYPTSYSNYPDVEDIDKDQTMNPINSYFEYKISLNKSDLVTGTNNIIDTKTTTVTLRDGTTRSTTWYQFRIPIRNNNATRVGGISDFNSIRFIRMYLTKFKMPVVLRFGELELVRGDWRRYTKTLNSAVVPQADLTVSELNNFEVGVVNIEQNENKYVLPPGITRERLQGTNRIQRQNEQSVSLKVTDLPSESIRAIYKNISIDMRRYENLRMFIHLEKPSTANTNDDEIKAVVRLGTDLNDNFYQVEMPLKLSTLGSKAPLEVWPEANNLNITLAKLANLKLERDAANLNGGSFNINQLYPAPSASDTGLVFRVKGNPTLAQIRTVMLGVKNSASTGKTGEVWFNELRAVGFENKGGWATVISADANFADVANVSLDGRMSTIGFGNIEDKVQQRSLEDVKQYSIATNVNLEKVITPKKWHLQIPMSYSYGEEFRDPKFDPQYQDIKLKDAKRVNPNSKNSQDYTKRKSISFINVKKNRNPESKKKPRFYDVENLTFSYSFNEEYHKDYNVQKYLNQNVIAGIGYSFNFKPYYIEPFKETKAFQNRYFQLLKDINFNFVPKTIAVNSQINRNYNQQQSRNLIAGLSPQPVLTQRRFMFDWDYALGFELTKSLQFNFNASNNYIYDELGSNENLDIHDKFFTIGRPNNYRQKLNATYKIPINKIPFLNFITADYGYTADFNWKSNSQSYVAKVGNAIDNANTHNLNVNVNLDRLYKKIKLDKLLFKNSTSSAKKVTGTNNKKLKKSASTGQQILKGFYDILTSVKRAKISYSQNNGTMLEGYKPEIGFLGRDNYNGGFAPTLGFVFGSQVDVLNTAIQNNWLVSRGVGGSYYNKSYTRASHNKLNYNFTVKPFKDFTIDFRGNRIKAKNSRRQIDVINDGNNLYQNPEIQPFEMGNFSISHSMIGTTFQSSESLYNKFLSNREIIRNRLAAQTGLNKIGYKKEGQQAMLPAFVAAYSGSNPNMVNTGIFRNIPIPNWSFRYSGLSKNKWVKKHFNSILISHGYKSSYTIGNYTNNLQYDANNPTLSNISGNYQPELLISSATLIDEFSPLIRLNMNMKNAFSFKGEVKTDRRLGLNFNNNTLTDVKGTEYIFGLGYKIKDVKLVTRITGKKQTLKGNINFRADVSFRNDLTLIRSIDNLNTQVTAGERLFGLKFIADYNLNRNLTASFYYNHQTFNYAISTTFPRQNINAGINIIYNIGN